MRRLSEAEAGLKEGGHLGCLLYTSFFRALGFEVKISDASTRAMYDSGLSATPSATVCFPAKLVHGHLRNLVKYGAVSYTHLDVYKRQVHINRLREKIEDDARNPRIIETIWGAGYRLNL